MRDESLQRQCREYLSKLRHMAEKHGLGGWINTTIRANVRGECEGTRKEVELLSRCVDDERIGRADIPVLLGKSYRQCFDDGDFDRIRKLPHTGIYSKVDAVRYRDSGKSAKKR